jgi:hypothetical protein
MRLDGRLLSMRCDGGLVIEHSALSLMVAEVAGAVCGDVTTTGSGAPGPAHMPM